MLVSAVVVHLGKTDLLMGCLTSLNTSITIECIETIVVDNASDTPELEQIVTDYPNTRIVSLPKRCGYSTASNAGIHASNSKYILWCNNDLIFTPDAIKHLVIFLENHPEYGAAGPQLLNVDGSYQPSFSLINLGLKALLVERLGLAKLSPGHDISRHWHGHEFTPQDVAVGTGACCLIRRDALEQIGGIDERFYMYTEEFDLCYRLWQGGWRVRYVPEARITHLGGQTTRQTPYVFVLQSWRSRYAYMLKHYGTWAETVLAVAVIVSSLFRRLLALFVTVLASILGNTEKACEYKRKSRFHASLIQLSLTPDRHNARELRNTV